MMATSKKKLEQEPGEIEMLLPWHAAGTLNARDCRRVDEALARDPDIARQYAMIREEYAETIHFNESLGAPSARALQKLFAAIDAEPPRKARSSLHVATRSPRANEPITRELGAAALPRALVRFAPDARVADITALLDKYQASIIDGAEGGMFRLQFGSRTMSRHEVAGLLGRLQNEKIVRLAVATP